MENRFLRIFIYTYIDSTFVLFLFFHQDVYNQTVLVNKILNIIFSLIYTPYSVTSVTSVLRDNYCLTRSLIKAFLYLLEDLIVVCMRRHSIVQLLAFFGTFNSKVKLNLTTYLVIAVEVIIYQICSN